MNSTGENNGALNTGGSGELKNFKHEELLIKIFPKDRGFNMLWTGKSRDRNPSAVLEPYLQGVADNLKGGALFCDFSELEFMNSSTVPAIISFVEALEKNGVKCIIYYNKALEWQVASFSALAVIVKFMDNVNLEGK